MTIKALSFGSISDLGRAINRIADFNLFRRPDELYKHLLVARGGWTYLLEDIRALSEDEAKSNDNSKIIFVDRNRKAHSLAAIKKLSNEEIYSKFIFNRALADILQKRKIVFPKHNFTEVIFPVVTPSGHTFEKLVIDDLLNQRGCDPVEGGEKLYANIVFINRSLLDLQKLRKEQPDNYQDMLQYYKESFKERKQALQQEREEMDLKIASSKDLLLAATPPEYLGKSLADIETIADELIIKMERRSKLISRFLVVGLIAFMVMIGFTISLSMFLPIFSVSFGTLFSVCPVQGIFFLSSFLVEMGAVMIAFLNGYHLKKNIDELSVNVGILEHWRDYSLSKEKYDSENLTISGKLAKLAIDKYVFDDCFPELPPKESEEKTEAKIEIEARTNLEPSQTFSLC